MFRSQARVLRFLARPLAGGAGASAGETPNGRSRRFLVLRLDELGDVILTVPLLKQIRTRFPDSTIEIVVHPGLESLLEGSALVDEISVFKVTAPRTLRPLILPLRAIRWRWHRRSSPTPDIAINARAGPDSLYAGFLAFVSGAPIRLGVTERATPRKSVLNAGFDGFYTATAGTARVTHDADASAALIELLKVPSTSCRPTVRVSLAGAPAIAQSHIRRVAMCVSGGHSVLKRWPLDRFAILANLVAERLAADVVIVGNDDDAQLASRIQWPAGTINLAGKTSLEELKAVLAAADAYVGADVGPTHVAALVGTPTIALFGSSVPAVFAPRGDHVTVLWHKLPCNPASTGTTDDGAVWSARYFGAERCVSCIHASPMCMEALSVDEVLAALESDLSAKSQA